MKISIWFLSILYIFTGGLSGMIRLVNLTFKYENTKILSKLIMLIFFVMISIFIYLLSILGSNNNINTAISFYQVLFLLLLHLLGVASVRINRHLGYTDAVFIYVLTIFGFVSSFWIQSRINQGIH